MTVEEQPITSEQMYRIEDNGHSIFGMKKVLMMENAGHGLADFIVSEKGPTFAGKKIISFCGTGNNGGDAMVASRHLSSQSGVEVTIVLVGDANNMKTEETLVNWSIVQKNEINKNPHRTKCYRVGQEQGIRIGYNYRWYFWYGD